MKTERPLNYSVPAVNELTRAQEFIQTRSKILDQIYNSPEKRSRILTNLYNQSLQLSQPSPADYALMLGTSYLQYPDKFKQRLHWTMLLYRQGLVKKVIFSGATDAETADTNQANDARLLAKELYNLPESDILLVGGTNTQENFAETKEILNLLHPDQPIKLHVVSSNLHLIRSVAVARHEFKNSNISFTPAPLGGPRLLDHNSPQVILELLKGYAYNHNLYASPFSSPSVRQFVTDSINKQLRHYTRLLDPIPPDPQEHLPFLDWLNSLPQNQRLDIK